ncbi:MAG: insulinase family protein [Planctomycetota bacterium]|jgi:Zn-dependent M16 (insulinase) family peptidase
MSDSACPQPVFSPGDEYAGFRIGRVQALGTLGCTAYEAEHLASGLRLLHLHATDRECLFSLALRTPPTDDSGIAHILEHTVLCGSKRYPVKDPFVELLKSSLATFLNAMTWPDRTVYPCASMNKRDFFNLASVYCDAVFHPLLREEHFKQEGHRLGFSTVGDAQSALQIKGIVYNEMKGAYSDFTGTFWRASDTGICPDNCYGYDSGGVPSAIPSLTYEAFCDFHARYYHPSNAHAFAYGDVAPQDLLDFLAKELTGFTASTVDATIAQPQRWTTPRRREVGYPLAEQEDPSAKYALSVSWLCCPVTDSETWLALKVLGGYLLDNDASPLRQDLIASGLGGSLTPAGYMDHVRDTWFTVGLRDIHRDDAARVEAVITACLAQQAEGLDRDLLEAAFHQFELDIDDVPGQYPLTLMERAYQRWLYGADPLEAVDLGPHLAALRARVDAEPDFFVSVLREQLVDNPHRLVQLFVPDCEHGAKQAQAEAAQVAAIEADLDAAARVRLAGEDAALEAAQMAANSDEALATLPQLSLGDVPQHGDDPVVTSVEHNGALLLHSAVHHAGVSHLSLALDLADLDDDLIEWLPLFTTALTRMGAGGASWDVLARQQDAVMGDIGAGVSCASRVDGSGRAVIQLGLSTCALHRNVAPACGILEQRLLAMDLDDHDRLRELIRERAADVRTGVIPAGSGYAGSYARRHLRPSAAMSERRGGFSQIRHTEALAADLDGRFAEVVEALTRIRDFVAGRSALTMSAVGAETIMAPLESLLATFAGRVGGSFADTPSSPSSTVIEGVATASDVAFVARIADIGPVSDGEAAALRLLASQLQVGHLWETIRVRGGAYGARCAYDRHAGLFSVSSYRDPNIEPTLAAFAGIADHVVADMALDDAALEQAIIGTTKSLDRPLRPEGVVSASLWRHLVGSTAANRQAQREALLGLDAATVRRVAAERLGPALAAGPGCVLAGREALAAASSIDSVSDL